MREINIIRYFNRNAIMIPTQYGLRLSKDKFRKYRMFPVEKFAFSFTVTLNISNAQVKWHSKNGLFGFVRFIYLSFSKVWFVIH